MSTTTLLTCIPLALIGVLVVAVGLRALRRALRDDTLLAVTEEAPAPPA